MTRDERGAAPIEFSILSPVLCLLVGAFDVAHTLYMRGTMQGIVQKTARDATLETNDGASQTALDAKVKAQVPAVANNATTSSLGASTAPFARGGRPGRAVDRYQPEWHLRQ